MRDFYQRWRPRHCFASVLQKKKLREQPNLSEPLEPPKNSRVWFGLVWDGGTITTLSVKEPELFISVKCFSRLKNAPSGAYFFVPFVFSFPFFRIGQALLVSKHEGNGVSGWSVQAGWLSQKWSHSFGWGLKTWRADGAVTGTVCRKSVQCGLEFPTVPARSRKFRFVEDSFLFLFDSRCRNKKFHKLQRNLPRAQNSRPHLRHVIP